MIFSSRIFRWHCCHCVDGLHKDPSSLAYPGCRHGHCANCTREPLDEDHQGDEYSNRQARLTQHLGVLVGFSVAAGAALDATKYFLSWSSWYCTSAGDEKLKSMLWGACLSDESTFCTHHILVDVVAFTVASTVLYHLNSGDQAQDRFLFGGVTSGLAIGIGKGNNIQETILSVLPWTILFSLAASQVRCAIMKSKRLCTNLKCPNYSTNCTEFGTMEKPGP